MQRHKVAGTQTGLIKQRAASFDAEQRPEQLIAIESKFRVEGLLGDSIAAEGYIIREPGIARMSRQPCYLGSNGCTPCSVPAPARRAYGRSGENPRAPSHAGAGP